MAAATFSAKDLATECGTDGRTIRKFLRSHLPAEDQPGQGGRYAFTKGEMKKLKTAFEASTKTKSTEDDAGDKPKAKSTKKKSKKAPVPDFEIGGNGDREPDEDVLDAEAIDDPSDEDIEELDFEIDDLDS